MKKRIITTLTLTAIILSATFAANATTIDVAYDDIKIFVNAEEVKTDVFPFIFNGRTFLPIRPVAEALGAYVDWNNETKTVQILNYRVGELKAISNGLYEITDCNRTAANIDVAINDLIDRRNDLVANRWNNLDETLANKIAFLDQTCEYLEWQISTYIPNLAKYPNTSVVNTDDIKNAFYYCQMAIHNIKLGYDELKKYNPDKDNSIILQNYAVFKEKAITYNTDAFHIFLQCQDNFLDVINSY